MAGKPKKVSREEIWASMDKDTQSFIKMLTQPVQICEWHVRPIEGTPYTERVQVMVERRITLKAIKLEGKNEIWMDGHPECKSKPKSVDR